MMSDKVRDADAVPTSVAHLDQHWDLATRAPRGDHQQLLQEHRWQSQHPQPQLHGASSLQGVQNYMHVHRRGATTALVALARVLERVDEQLLPAVYLYVGCAFGASPSQLGAITFSRAVVQAVSSPLGGVLGHYYNRAHVVAGACLFWSIFTAGFALAGSVRQGMALWAFNGLGLACLVPNAQSLVADYYPARQRGRAFGLLLCVGNAGTMLGTLYATNIGGAQIAGLAGWRFAFLTVAAFSAAVGLATYAFARDPRCPEHRWRVPISSSSSSGGGFGMQPDALGTGGAPGRPIPAGEKQSAQALVCEMWSVLSTPSFIVVVLQGIVGSTPWNAFAFSTLYFQLQGWSDQAAAAVLGTFSGADAIGALLGGYVGDAAAKRFPDHGRIAVCQLSVAIGVPLSALLFKALPLGAGIGIYVLYAALLALTGLLISWAATACNNPIFAEIVPARLRTLVYAFDRSFEGAISAMGAPLVGLAAERMFHFGGAISGGTADCNPAEGGLGHRHVPNLEKAHALGNALLLFTVVPWTLCALVYSLLHWTYPRDKRLRGRGEGEDALPGALGAGATAFSPLAVEEALADVVLRGSDDEGEVPLQSLAAHGRGSAAGGGVEMVPTSSVWQHQQQQQQLEHARLLQNGMERSV